MTGIMNKGLNTIFLAIMLISLAGCTSIPSVGPDYQPPAQALPTDWSTSLTQDIPSTTAGNLTRWWQQFDDAQLNRLIEEALSANPDLHLAQAKLRQVRATRDQAISRFFPVLTASTAASRRKSAEAISTSRTRTVYDAGFDASWEIDIFGGSRRALEAATADQQASEADLNHVRVTLVAEVAQSYVELRATQQRLAIARKNLASQSETLQITEWRNQAGLVGSSDVEQARTNREQTRASIPDLEVALSAAENRLAVLLGQHPGKLHAQLKEVKALPDLPPRIATRIPADVIRQRPDLISAERTLAAETARVGQKLAQRFPSLNLTGAFGWQAYAFGALGGADTLTRAIAGTLAATLFDGGNLRSAVDIQSAVQEQALLTYQKSVLTALEEIENALQSYAQGREQVEARRAAAKAARNAATLTRDLYRSGLSDFQQVLETERTLLNAEDRLASAEGGMRTNLIKLYKALGGGWESGVAPQFMRYHRETSHD